jgi:tight adherence protein C
MNPIIILLFFISIPMGVFSFMLLKMPGELSKVTNADEMKHGKSHHLVFRIVVSLFLSIIGWFITDSVRTGLAIALVIFLTGIHAKFSSYSRRKTRLNVISRELPLLLDFLVLQVESGHSILQAFKFASVLFPESSPVNLGLMKFQEKIQFGTSVQTALEELGSFLGTTGAETALLTISQAIKHGTPLGKVLRKQANRMSEQLVVEGEKFANTLSVRLLIPLLFFIFPASFIVIFSPVIVSLTKILP